MIPRHATDRIPRTPAEPMTPARWNALSHKERHDYLDAQMPTWEEIQAIILQGGMGAINPGDTIYVRPRYVDALREINHMMSLGLDVRAKNYNTADWKEMP